MALDDSHFKKVQPKAEPQPAETTGSTAPGMTLPEISQSDFMGLAVAGVLVFVAVIWIGRMRRAALGGRSRAPYHDSPMAFADAGGGDCGGDGGSD